MKRIKILNIKTFIIATAIVFGAAINKTMAEAIGTWKAYMSYYDITEIEEAGNILYVLASQNLYSYNTTDQSIQTYDKSNFLNECNIEHIAWNPTVKKLLIVYSNGKFDLLDRNDNVENISDYYNKSMTEDKTINSIYIYNQYAYLSTSFGVLQINMDKVEISNTYNLGINVKHTYVEGNRLYASSLESGTYSGDMSDNLIDKSNWTRIGDYAPYDDSIDENLFAIANTLNPGGPKYNRFSFLRYYNNKLYTVPGYFRSGSLDEQVPGSVQVYDFDSQDWQIYQERLDTIIGHKYLDNNCIAVDKNDENHVFVGGRTGLFEFENGSFKANYDKNNSILTSALVGEEELPAHYTIICGMEYDESGNLWILNSATKKYGIYKLSANGQLTAIYKEGLIVNDHVMANLESPIFDKNGNLWFVCNHWNNTATFCYDIKNDSLYVYNTLVNQDGTIISATNMQCVAEDNDGNIWIGTNRGPVMIPESQLLTDDKTLTQVKVPRNDGTNYADYLLSGIDVTCMAIDGGGRKWFGTNGNGVYLISEDNMTQISHFTSDDSSLLSDIILSIDINDITGEVFIATSNGLCSYFSDATGTTEEMTKDNVYAYPNPVTPDYTGLITIVGLSYNSDVKILTSNGMLVAEGRSNGGTFTWNGCDKNGKKVASGIYMVATATNEGKKGTVCKIAVIK